MSSLLLRRETKLTLGKPSDALKECTANDIRPIVTDITSIIDAATAQVKSYVDAKVDLNVVLAETAGVKAGVAVTIDVLIKLFVSLVTVSTPSSSMISELN